jgi:hypothetical protein
MQFGVVLQMLGCVFVQLIMSAHVAQKATTAASCCSRCVFLATLLGMLTGRQPLA